jgi:hypothetical protein
MGMHKMFDYPSISSALSSIKAATDIARLIKESGISLEKAENKLKIAELLTSLADVKINLAEIQQTILEKDNIIKELNEKLKLKEKLNFETPFYWLQESEDKDGPFCQHCYDKDSKLMRLQKFDQGRWQCTVCKNFFHDDDYKPIKPIRIPKNSRTI